MKNAFFRWLAMALMIFSLTAVFAFTGVAAELRDYRLPSEKMQGGSSATGTVQQRKDVYLEFRVKIEKLTSAQKKELRESFCKKLQATDKESEKNYYLNLIRIIDESERTR